MYAIDRWNILNPHLKDERVASYADEKTARSFLAHLRQVNADRQCFYRPKANFLYTLRRWCEESQEWEEVR